MQAPEVALQLAKILGEPADPPRVEALRALPAPARVIAIDGSHVTLAESGSHKLAAFRAASVSPGAPAFRTPLEFVLLEKGELVESHRERAETDLASESAMRLSHGDMLLLDGPLRRVENSSGLDVIGVCKSTSLTVGGAPAIAACHMAARSQSGPWLVELRPNIFVARLTRNADRPFRFDVQAHDGNARRALASLASLAGHPGYPGYPSPLAMAHHAAVIAEDERRRTASDIMDLVEKAGVRGDAWRAAFQDYHDVLELGV